MRRNWIKLYVDQCLRGTMMKELPYNERWLWFGILLLAGDSPFEGKICITEKIGYTDEQIAELLETPVDVYRSAKEKMLKHDKISVDKNGVIKIVNWKKYQSEYLRQKPHRDPNFIKLREEIKNRDDFTCQECFKHEVELKIPLCVHHIDNDTTNNIPQNLITLCMRCHSKLLKENVHKTKKKELEVQKKRFKRKVQEKGATKSASGDIDIDIDREKEKDNINNINREFEEFWKFYHTIGNKGDDPGDKPEALKAYKTLRKKESKGNVVKATNGYGEFLKHKELKEGFKQKKMYTSTFLRSKRWERFLTFKFTPSL